MNSANDSLRISDEALWPALTKKHRPTAITKTARDKSPNTRQPIAEETTIHLLQHLHETDSDDGSNANIRQYVKDLKLRSAGDSGFSDLRWDVSANASESLKPLPKPEEHSGQFEWIGSNKEAVPRFLYDSRTRCTFEPTLDHFREGYIAVSWTWGRFQCGKQTRRSGGTEWKVPKIWSAGWYYDLVHDLKDCLARLPNRYFWVDVLCINQVDQKDKTREINKQAEIFRRAKGVICYLWDLQGEASLRTPIEGLGVLLRWALTFGENVPTSRVESDRQSSKKDAVLLPYVEAFELLRQDKWFSSLWALQEIVLAPAGIWMTRTGDVLKLNGEWLTTRRMAMIMRVLSWAGRRRAQLWADARHDYKLKCNMTHQKLKELETEFQRKQAAIESMVKQQYQQHQAPGSKIKNRFLRPVSTLASSTSSSFYRNNERGEHHLPNLVVEGFPSGRVPWLFRRYNQEAILREELEKWTRWSFGTACIDISLSATRAAILVAAMNRSVMPGDRREPALMSALKIEPDDRFMLDWRKSQNTLAAKDRKYLSPYLMNVMLKGEGLKLFNVEHHVLNADTENYTLEALLSVILESESLEKSSLLGPSSESGYRLIHAEEYPVRRSRARRRPDQSSPSEDESAQENTSPLSTSILTNMFPATACNLNTLILHFDSMYQWLPHKDWHLHDGGVVHIPMGTICHDVYRSSRGARRKFDLRIRPNGDYSQDERIQSYSQLKYFASKPLLAKIVDALRAEDFKMDRPPFMFIPVGKLRNMILTDGQDLALLQNVPETIGVVLVGGHRIGPHESLTRWYKFGIYTASNLVEDRLRSKDGILVTSYEERDAYPVDLRDCEELKRDADFHLHSHNRVLSDDPDYVKVTYDHWLPSRQSMLSVGPQETKKLWSFRELLTLRRS